jgi:hypothetical protein
MFKFSEGACVTLKSDNAKLGLAAGAKGTIWALYETKPPAYEVTFSSEKGVAFDALMYEEELAELVQPLEMETGSPVRSLASA